MPKTPSYDAMTVPLEWDGHTHALCFTWGVFATLRQEWGDGWSERLIAMFKGDPADVEFVARLITDGALTGGVPVGLFTNRAYAAFRLAWSGDQDDEPREDETEAGKKRRTSWLSSMRREPRSSALASHGRASTA